MTSIQTITSLASLTMSDVTYQVTGMCVVFCCLAFLSVILTVSGTVAQKLDASRKARAEAARAALVPAAPAPAPAAAPAPAGSALTPVEVATLAASLYDEASSSITPQVVAAISAAVAVTVGHEAHILAIRPVGTEYAHDGRSQTMHSHSPFHGA